MGFFDFLFKKDEKKAPVRRNESFFDFILREGSNTFGKAVDTAIDMTPVGNALKNVEKEGKKIDPDFDMPNASESAGDIFRAIPQAGARIGMAITGDKEYTPGNQLEKTLLGNEPVKNFEGYGRDTADIFGQGDKLSPGLATGIGFALSALDAAPQGKGSKKVIDILVNSKSADDVAKALKGAETGLNETQIKNVAPQIAKSTNENEIRNIISNAAETPSEIVHASQVPVDQIKQEGFKMGENSAFGQAAFFTDSGNFKNYGAGDNNLIKVDPGNFKIKEVGSLADQNSFIKEQGAKNLAEATQKAGFDGFVIRNSDPNIGSTYGIVNKDKLDTTIRQAPTSPAPEMSTQDKLMETAFGPAPKQPGIKNTEVDQRAAVSQQEFNDVLRAAKEANGKAGFEQPELLPTTIKDKGLKTTADRLAGSVTGQLSRMGESGKELATTLTKHRDTAETLTQKYVRAMPTVMKLKNNEFENLFDVVEKNAAPKSDNVARAAEEWKAVAKQVLADSDQAKVNVGNLGDTYIPHDYSALFKDKAKFNQIANRLVSNGKAENIDEAVAILNEMNTNIRNGKVFGSFDFERTLDDFDGYEKSKDAIIRYLSGAGRKIADMEHFGDGDANINRLVSAIGKEGYDINRARDLVNTAVYNKQYDELANKASQKIRGYLALTKLGLAAISNIGQVANTATVAGIFRTAGAIAKNIGDPEAKALMQESAVASKQVVSLLGKEQGFMGNVINKYLTAPGISLVERVQRSISAVAGMDYANSLAAKASKGNVKALKKLREDFGIEGAIGKELTKEQSIKAMRSFVERTQFRTSSQDLPAWASTPIGKLVFLFQSFPYKQTKFMAQEVYQPLLKGNVLPLARFMAIGLPLGLGISELRSLIKGEDTSDETAGEKTKKAAMQTGMFGIPGSIVQNFSYTRDQRGDLDPLKVTRAAATTGLGPAGGFSVDAIKALTGAANGKPEELGRFGLKQIPGVGGRLANTLLPYDSESGGGSGGSGGSGSGSSGRTKVATKPKSSSSSTKVASSRGGSRKAATAKGGKKVSAKKVKASSKVAKVKSPKKAKSVKVKVARTKIRTPKVKKVKV